jgi:uncharacterized OB-fold protein
MTYRDRRHYKKCLHCDALVLPPRRKCNNCRKVKKYTVTELRPSRKGANATGTCLHKPDKVRTKRAKRQNADKLASVPHMKMSNWRMI